MTEYQENLELTISIKALKDSSNQVFVSVKANNSTILFSSWIDKDKVNDTLPTIVNSLKSDILHIIKGIIFKNDL